MSLAPASSLGAFLKARLAVNGIQCAARSFGTLTAAERGLLSSMGASCVLENWRVWRKVSASLRDGNASGSLYFRPFGRFDDWHPYRSAAPTQNTSPSESSVSSHSSGN